MQKVPFLIDKKAWSPSLIPRPVMLVSIINSKAVPNIAPKSWVQMISFRPSILMFSGSKGNTTGLLKESLCASNGVEKGYKIG